MSCTVGRKVPMIGHWVKIWSQIYSVHKASQLIECLYTKYELDMLA